MKIETIKKEGVCNFTYRISGNAACGVSNAPNLLNLEALQTVEQLVGRFHNQPIYHIGHLIVMLMCAGYIPWGVRILQGRMKCPSKACPIYNTKKDKNFKCLQPCG